MPNETLQQISLDLVDDPVKPMRSSMDDERLDELSASIKQHGLIQPITVRQVGSRYEVVAGHRRYTAAKRAGLVNIPAIVRVLSDLDTDSMRMHENLYRADINPVDEARYIRVMVDEHNMDPVELSKITGKSEAYLMGRYALLDYPDYLIAAVEKEEISLSAAQWLAKIKDDTVRAEYTRFATLGGITAKRAEAWFRSWELGSLPREAHMYTAPPADPSAEPIALKMPCVICHLDDDIEKMGMHYAHGDCVNAIRKVI